MAGERFTALAEATCDAGGETLYALFLEIADFNVTGRTFTNRYHRPHDAFVPRPVIAILASPNVGLDRVTLQHGG
jgi:hypothetical protein